MSGFNGTTWPSSRFTHANLLKFLVQKKRQMTKENGHGGPVSQLQPIVHSTHSFFFLPASTKICLPFNPAVDSTTFKMKITV